MPPVLVATALEMNLTPAQVVHCCLRISYSDNISRDFYVPSAKAIAEYLGPDRDPHELPDREGSDERYPLFPDPTGELTYNKPGVTFWMLVCNTGGQEIYIHSDPSRGSAGWGNLSRGIRAGESSAWLCRFRDEHVDSNGEVVEPRITHVLWQGASLL